MQSKHDKKMKNKEFLYKMIHWVCIFYTIQHDGTNINKRLVYRDTDREKKTERDAIIKYVLRNGLGNISSIEDIINQEISKCTEEGLKYSMAIYYNNVLVEPDVCNNLSITKQLYFDLQNLYQDDLI